MDLRRAVAVALLVAGCARSSGTLEVKAAFSDDTVVADLDAAWRDDGEAGGTEARRWLTFRVDARNRLSTPLYLRLGAFRLLGPWGATERAGAIGCVLAPGTTAGVLRGTVAVPAGQAGAVRGFEVDRFAVPLSERGRAFYREFLLRQRPNDGAAIDAELAAFAAAPACPGG